MNKSLALLLVWIICVFIMACGGENQDAGVSLPANKETLRPTEISSPIDGDILEETEGISVEVQDIHNREWIDEQMAALVVHIEINPKVEILVGEDGAVQDAVGLNEDATALLQNLDIKGKSCEEATYMVVNEAVEQGFLKENGKLQLMVAFSPNMAAQMDRWMDLVQKSVIHVLETHNMGAQLVFDSIVIEPLENGQEGSSTIDNTAEEVVETAPEETDSNGNTIVRQEDGTVLVLDKDGKVLQMTEPDGIVTKMNYDGSGKLAFQEQHLPEGVVAIHRYDENGILTSTEINDLTGWQVSMYYDTSGNLVLKEMSDQSYAYTYYSNGAIATEIEKQANGFTRERHYYENGIVSREYELWDDGTYRDNYFDQNGNITQANFKNGVGGVEERTFRPDGTSYGYYYDPSGPIFYYEFDASGRQLLDTHRQIN